jgi:hypothetical protein
MYPSYALLGQNKDKSIAALPVDDLIEKADGFAGVFPGMIQFNGGNDMLSVSFPIFSRSQIRDCKMPASTCNTHLCIILGCFQTLNNIYNIHILNIPYHQHIFSVFKILPVRVMVRALH